MLGLIVAEFVFTHHPDQPEGSLTKMRAAVVNADALAAAATEVGLGEEMRFGKGEAASGGGSKPSILADAMEAVIGAVYLDGGYDAARELVLRLLDERLDEAASRPGDFKTQLQELAARRGDTVPAYSVHDEGPDHAKRFYAAVHVGDAVLGEGEGRTKKQAEQAAARQACDSLASDGQPDREAPVPAGAVDHARGRATSDA